ncbi:VPLPA-CTERM sorting domain-containing protein [Hyphococcus sp.]|uniref:VPLPA-CTERM sorting domain-containing protein n=1 Tax=Hyphococcus sp. TaxID=2038636 RepID=UPI00208274E8|nr:MAG: hypothetical protein DHS20C04_12190 [Marinicaulis sp.]
MKNFVTALVSGAMALAVSVGAASANLITIDDGLGTIECTVSCEAFTGAGGNGAEPTGAGTLSSSAADYYDGTPSSESAEADRLSTLITGSTGLFAGTDGTRTTGSGGSQMFSTLAEYVVLKIGNVAVFIKNTSGGMLTVDYTSFPGAGSGLSHYTEFGGVSDVPLPAAAWLMIAGFAGLNFAGRRKAA